MVRQDEGASPDGEADDAMSIDGQNQGAEEDQEDEEDDEEEEDPASGSEFSAGSEDVARQEKEDRAFDEERLDHIAGNAVPAGRDRLNQQRGVREDSQTSQPRGKADITMDAELDPDLYGLRRSVSKASVGASYS
jgi:hypothetical protein